MKPSKETKTHQSRCSIDLLLNAAQFTNGVTEYHQKGLRHNSIQFQRALTMLKDGYKFTDAVSPSSSSEEKKNR